MRDLLRGYADRGGTVLLSSHLLHEIEVIADDIVMIGNGRIVSQGTKTELLQGAGTLVRAEDLSELERALGALRAWLRCHPVVAHNSSRIRPFSALPDRRYRVAIVLVTACRWLIVNPTIRAYLAPQNRPGRRAPRAHS